MIRLSRFKAHLAAALMAGMFALTASPAAMANEVVALKNALYGAGYEINNTAPEMDSTTRNSLEKFQRDNGLTASGVLDQSTKEALGMVSVQVAAAPPGSSSGDQGDSSASTAVAEPQSEPEDADEEEEDDGGWSFF